MDLLWLGYDGLSVRYIDVAAVLFYHPSLDGRVVMSYGVVPARVQAVVVTSDGAFFPSRWSVDELRTRLTQWRHTGAPGEHSGPG